MRGRWDRAARVAIAAGTTAIVLAVLGAVALLTIGGGRPPRHATLPPEPTGPRALIGASVNLLFNSPGLSSEQISAQLAALRATGATVARSDALWEASEPVAPAGGVHHYVWTFDDRIALALAAHQLQWLPIIDYAAPWAESIPGVDHSPPTSDAAYAAYAGAFAARYGLGGSFWRAHPEVTAEPVGTYEIWNEPDGGFWLPAPQPAQYSDLYLAARAAIHAVQPRAQVIVGGLTQPISFVPQMVAARPQLRGLLDGIAIHPYGTPPVMLEKIRLTRAALAGVGLGSVPLYVTEFGWSTSPPGTHDYAPAAQRPAYISATLGALGHLDCGIAATVIYTWYSPRLDPSNGQQWYGVDSLTGAPDADTEAFTAGVRRAGSPGPTQRLCR